MKIVQIDKQDTVATLTVWGSMISPDNQDHSQMDIDQITSQLIMDGSWVLFVNGYEPMIQQYELCRVLFCLSNKPDYVIIKTTGTIPIQNHSYSVFVNADIPIIWVMSAGINDVQPEYRRLGYVVE